MHFPLFWLKVAGWKVVRLQANEGFLPATVLCDPHSADSFILILDS
jgi:hypothetical protein